jgi:hypothetical protein
MVPHRPAGACPPARGADTTRTESPPVFLYDMQPHLCSSAVVVAMHPIRRDELRQDQFPDRMCGLCGGELT